MAMDGSGKDLIDRIIEGDRRSFTIFYDKFQGIVYRTAFGYFHNNADADEVVQDVFIEVYLHTENLVLIDGDGHIRGLYNGTLEAEIPRISEDIRILLDTNL